MKLRMGLALLFVFVVPLAVDGQNPSVPPPTAEQKESVRRIVMKRLSEQKLPKVEFEGIQVREALEFFATKTHLNMVIALGDEGPAPPLKPITIHRRNMPLTEFLDEVCKQSGLKWVIEYPGLVRITPK